MGDGEERDGVRFTHLDDPLFDGAGVTKRDLVDYLDSASSFILPELEGRPLSVVRAHRDGDPFMQKNLPRYTPEWVARADIWAEASKRQVSYALCNDRRTLLWFANQRAVEYHPALVTADDPSHQAHLVLDIDPPGPGTFPLAAQVAVAAREALRSAGLEGAAKTSGSKGLHIWVPVQGATVEEASAATRALAARTVALVPEIATTQMLKADRGRRVFVDATRAGSATVVAAFSPRARPGLPVSFPVAWDGLPAVRPELFHVRSFAEHRDQAAEWVRQMPGPGRLPGDLVEEGRSIPVPRALAMHEGRRRSRAAEANR